MSAKIRLLVPSGTVDNSPAIHRWAHDGPSIEVPSGTTEPPSHGPSSWPIPSSAITTHCVFSTKERRKLITPELEVRLWPFLGGIARAHRMRALAIGGVEDHVHLLLSLPSTLAIAKAIQLVKGESSKWVHDTFPEHRQFAWQEGYGAFTIGVSQLDVTVAYIQNQKEHHRKATFQEEFLSFLKKHGIEYDPRYVWG